MDLKLLNYINLDMKWTIMRKGRTGMTRWPRKPGADSFELGNKIHESGASERKKSGTYVLEKVVDAPLKKRRLLHQSASPLSQTMCINGEEGMPPESQTSSIHHVDSGQQSPSNSLSQSHKTKSETRLRNSKILKPTNEEVLVHDDFSGIELLAAVACSFIRGNADHVEDVSISKEHTTSPGVDSCTLDIKDADPSSSSIQQNFHDNGKEVEEKKAVLSKEVRLHWDLNTVMEEWEKPCDDLLIDPQLSVMHDAAILLVPLVENCNNGSVEETHELIEDLKGMGTNNFNIKASDGESSVSKSDMVDSSIHSGKGEDLSNSTTSVLMEQTVVNFESDRGDNPLAHTYFKATGSKLDQLPVSEELMQGFCCNKVTTDHVIECRGSNVTQEEQGHMTEGDSQAGYDSPFEDGELRVLIKKTEKEIVYVSDNIYKDDLGIVENPWSEKVDHCQTMDYQTSLLVKEAVPNKENKQSVQVDTSERPHFAESRKVFCERKDGNDELTRCFSVCRNSEYVQRNRSSASGDFSVKVWDLKSLRSPDSNYFRNYNPRDISYRTHDRRPSPSARNNGYGSNRGPPPASSHSRDRYRFRSQEYHDPKPCYLERKACFSPSFNQHGTRPKSRSGSPIAWHFQKRKNLDTSNSGDVSPERSSRCFDDRRIKDGQFRDNRQSSVAIKHRFDPIGYPERWNSDDYIRFTQRPVKFSQMTGYKHKG